MPLRPNDAPWLRGAFGDLGLHEIAGPKHAARVLVMFRTAGHPEVKNDETAWCAAGENTWLIEAGFPGTGKLNARSFLIYGQDVMHMNPLPRGAILIFQRGDSEWQGHVCTLLEDKGAVLRVIGANQSDQVCEANQARAHLIGARWPKGYPLPGAVVPLPHPKPKPAPEPDPLPVPQPPIPEDEQIEPEHKPAPKPHDDDDERPARKLSPWKRIRNWAGGGGGLLGGGGILAYLTDPWVILALAGVVLLFVVLGVCFIGPSRVRAAVIRFFGGTP